MTQLQLPAFMHAARRLLALLVLFPVLSLSESPDKHDLTFIQISDPHLFDAGKKRFDTKGILLTPENQLLAEKLDTWAAWDWALSYVNHLQDPKQKRIKFVIITGDFGLEKVTDLLPGSIDPNTKSMKTENYHKDLHGEECWGIDDAAKKVAQSFASLLVPKIYLVRGNNDLDADEDPGDAGRFDTFVEKVTDELNTLKASNSHLHPPDLINLTSVLKSPSNEEEAGYNIVGLDSSSFKNKPSKLPASTQPPSCPFGNKGKSDRDIYQIEELKRVYDQIWVKKPDQQTLLFTHIPDLDDRNCIDPLDGKNTCPSIASWNLSHAARTQWTAIMKQDKGKADKVAAIFAGHFHDSRRSTYVIPYTWTVSKNDSLQKTYVVPPLAAKFQIENVTGQSRGFSLVHVNGNPAKIDWQVYWLDTLPLVAPKPACESQVSKNSLEPDASCVCWLFVVGGVLTSGIFFGVLWMRWRSSKKFK